MAKVFEDDLTVIYLTANQMPDKWAVAQLASLFIATQGMPLITVSRKKITWGEENILDTEPKSHLNMYKQMLKAAKLAKTRYIAAAEDDVLYSRDHFTYMRPPLDTFAYNMSRWSVYSWDPIFSIKHRKSNCTLIAPRELFIEAWEERLAKFNGEIPAHRVGEVGRPNLDKWLGVTVRKCTEYWSGIPVIHLNHDNGTDSTEHRKRLGEHRALEIPYWGTAESVVELYRA